MFVFTPTYLDRSEGFSMVNTSGATRTGSPRPLEPLAPAGAADLTRPKPTFRGVIAAYFLFADKPPGTGGPCVVGRWTARWNRSDSGRIGVSYRLTPV
jgi:hypothetical protein